MSQARNEAQVDPRAIPEWLAPFKNEWRSMSTMAHLFESKDRPMTPWLEEIRPRLRVIHKPTKNGRGIARYYLVKQVWACALAHGLRLSPPYALRPRDVVIEDLERQVQALSAQVQSLAAKAEAQPMVRYVRPPDSVQMLTDMLGATEPRPTPGVYFLISQGVVTYVGQSQNVLGRMSGHTGKSFDTVKMLHIADPNQRMAEEGRWINAFEPINNIRGLEHRRAA